MRRTSGEGIAIPLSTPFAVLASELRDQVAVQRIRLASLEACALEQVRRGEQKIDPAVGFRGVKRALARMTDAAELMSVLVRHEAAVRALDPLLALPDPTLWAAELAAVQGLGALTSKKG